MFVTYARPRRSQSAERTHAFLNYSWTARTAKHRNTRFLSRLQQRRQDVTSRPIDRRARCEKRDPVVDDADNRIEIRDDAGTTSPLRLSGEILSSSCSGKAPESREISARSELTADDRDSRAIDIARPAEKRTTASIS